MRQLEDLIMDAIYQNVINANLDQKLKLVEVHSAMGRDLRPGQAQVMLKVLQEWYVFVRRAVTRMPGEANTKFVQFSYPSSILTSFPFVITTTTGQKHQKHSCRHWMQRRNR